MQLSAVGRPLADLDTPALLLDLDAFDHNVATMAGRLSARGVQWRPHAKGHKTPAIAMEEIRAGAIGATCAKVSEAEVLAAGGVRDILIATMIVAAVTVHWQHGLFATSNGIELPLIYGVFGAALALAGPGQYSLDALIGATALWTPAIVWSAIAVGIVGGVANLAIRRPAPAMQRATPRR